MSLLSSLSQQQYIQSQSCSNGSTSSSSYLIGYSQIKYYKDNYQLLCEYLFHSVYDSTSLESFELEQYLVNNVHDEQIEEKDLIEQIEAKHRLTCRHSSNGRTQSTSSTSSTSTSSSSSSSIFLAKSATNSFESSYHQFLKSSPFFNYYLNYLRKLKASKYASRLDTSKLDEFLTKGFRFVRLPHDWTLLGQLCYLEKGTLSAFHFVFLAKKSKNILDYLSFFKPKLDIIRKVNFPG